jgi:hypothetical protein
MKEIYLILLKQGWTLPAIDDMDFFYYLDLVAYHANKNRVTIDQIF